MSDIAPRPVVDVVVVGAGISGLATACGLLDRGHRIAILEARGRTGGRLRSTDSGLDLGASWFWPGEDRVAQLVSEAGVAVHPQHLRGDAVYDDRNHVARLDGNPIDVVASRFSTGADSLTDFLAERVLAHPLGSLTLSATVDRIQVSDVVDVEATGVDGPARLTASHAVLAIPPALATRSIEIDPALPDDLADLAAQTPVWMGAITKVVAVYSSPFWRDAGLSGSAVSHRGPMREIHDMSGPNGTPAALFGFAPTTASTGPVHRDSVIAQLTRLFGAAASDPVELHLADWRTEPSTSPPAVETITNHATFADHRFREPALGGRLHWTSTETGHVAPGHIEGALAASERTVATIDQDLTNRRQQKEPTS